MKLSIIQKIHNKKIISIPNYVVSSIQYEVMMGSIAYGLYTNTSDIDIYGFCIPDKETIFPHLKGEILDFGTQSPRFKQFQNHHINMDNKEYDLTIFNIVKYFSLLMQNNPNIIDSIFVPENCILYQSKIGKLVRENRKLFLHKGCFHRFKGYAFSQLHKIKRKNSKKGKRKDLIEKYGYDTKYATHLVRLIDECEQILLEEDLNLQRNRHQLKFIKEGEWTLNQLEEWFYAKEKLLEHAYNKSKLPHRPNETKIKELLLNCLEEYFGSLNNYVINNNKYYHLLDDLNNLITKYK